MTADIYQQAYLDHELTPKSITKLVANSGSGKSTTIASKVSQLIDRGVDPLSMIAITFTNASAWDLRGKIKKKSNQTLKYCSTFHGLAITLLKESGVNPIVMNEWQSILLIRKIMESNNLSTGNKRQDTTLARDFMNKFNYMRTVTYYLDPLEFPLLDHFSDITINLRQFIDIYMEFDRHKKDKNLWDFQDLISPRSEKQITVKPDTKYIWIDECQDNDYSQYVWIANLFSEPSYTLVGDVKQKLYCIDPKTKITILQNGVEKEITMGESQGLPADGSVKVMSRHGWSTFGGHIPQGFKETITVQFSDGTSLTCTPDHLIETENGWVEAKDLKNGSSVL